ncbi:serine/arginine repetitive matrix protein 2-like [Sycon ciliatum]|uniref:serine/arginine repetitive matrix protein 2-like n=1 Tax=Sycon ciliatum TaxID=27933 RepID=UPI0031F6C637
MDRPRRNVPSRVINYQGGYYYDEDQAMRAAISESLSERRREKREARRLESSGQASHHSSETNGLALANSAMPGSRQPVARLPGHTGHAPHTNNHARKSSAKRSSSAKANRARSATHPANPSSHAGFAGIPLSEDDVLHHQIAVKRSMLTPDLRPAQPPPAPGHAPHTVQQLHAAAAAKYSATHNGIDHLQASLLGVSGGGGLSVDAGSGAACPRKPQGVYSSVTAQTVRPPTGSTNCFSGVATAAAAPPPEVAVAATSAPAPVTRRKHRLKAQRKFPENSLSPGRRTSVSSSLSATSLSCPSTPGQERLTEDFISFLVLRGHPDMPARLAAFNTPPVTADVSECTTPSSSIGDASPMPGNALPGACASSSSSATGAAAAAGAVSSAPGAVTAAAVCVRRTSSQSGILHVRSDSLLPRSHSMDVAGTHRAMSSSGPARTAAPHPDTVSQPRLQPVSSSSSVSDVDSSSIGSSVACRLDFSQHRDAGLADSQLSKLAPRAAHGYASGSGHLTASNTYNPSRMGSSACGKASASPAPAPNGYSATLCKPVLPAADGSLQKGANRPRNGITVHHAPLSSRAPQRDALPSHATSSSSLPASTATAHTSVQRTQQSSGSAVVVAPASVFHAVRKSSNAQPCTEVIVLSDSDSDDAAPDVHSGGCDVPVSKPATSRSPMHNASSGRSLSDSTINSTTLHHMSLQQGPHPPPLRLVRPKEEEDNGAMHGSAAGIQSQHALHPAKRKCHAIYFPPVEVSQADSVGSCEAGQSDMLPLNRLSPYSTIAASASPTSPLSSVANSPSRYTAPSPMVQSRSPSPQPSAAGSASSPAGSPNSSTASHSQPPSPADSSSSSTASHSQSGSGKLKKNAGLIRKAQQHKGGLCNGLRKPPKPKMTVRSHDLRTVSGIPSVNTSITTLFPSRASNAIDWRPAKLETIAVSHPPANVLSDPASCVQWLDAHSKGVGMSIINNPCSTQPLDISKVKGCSLSCDMTYCNQYFHRWLYNSRYLAAVHHYLLGSGCGDLRSSAIDCVPADLVAVFQAVEKLGGYNTVEKEGKWDEVADLSRIPPDVSERDRSVPEIYLQYLHEYGLQTAVSRHQAHAMVDTDLIKGREPKQVDMTQMSSFSCTCAQHYALAKCMGSAWEVPKETTNSIEEEFWFHVLDGTLQVPVCTGITLEATARKQLRSPELNNSCWSPEALLSGPGSLLDGDVSKWSQHRLQSRYSAVAWHSAPASMYTVFYHHAGDPLVWYCIPGENCEEVESACYEINPATRRNGKSGAFPKNRGSQRPCLHPPISLANRGIPIHRGVVQQGQMVIIAPRAHVAFLNTGWSVTETTYYAPTHCLQAMVKSCSAGLVRSAHLPCNTEILWNVLLNPAGKLNTVKSLSEPLGCLRDGELQRRSQLVSAGISLGVMTSKNQESGGAARDNRHVCSVCRSVCFFSRVTDLKDHCYCLHHALELIKNKPKCKEMTLYCHVPNGELSSAFDNVLDLEQQSR